MIWLILLQIILIALNAIFAGTEIAVISVNETKLEKEVEAGNKRARWLLKMIQNSSGFLATIQVAITLSGFLGAAFASDSFAEILSQWLQKIGIGLSDPVMDTISVILVTLIMSYFSIVLGEMVPKRIAMKNAERLSLTMAGPITVIAKLFAPLVWLLTKSTNAVLRLCGIDPNSDDEIVTEEDLLLMADAGRKKGTIDATENDMIKNVFAFDDLTVGEICTHRKEVSVLWMDETIAEWEQTIHESRHTVYPVCGDSIDQIVGVLNAKDFFRLQNRTKAFVMEHAVHTPYFIHETLKADELFSKMKRHADHFAVVLDEYGGMCGIITVTDLVEQLVGDFDDDETAQQDPEVERLDSRSWKIRGTCSLHDVSKALEHEFQDEEYETFSGYLIGKLGEIPKDGTKLKMQVDGFQVYILNIRQHCVEKAIVRIPEPEEAAAEGNTTELKQ
ncbi:hemolysin family protein [uncultured Ruminococcus sp.]|uniref:hemolysin family protein n=1 Tax=uncultured Ruminococcus sp. TaxID=165186 RepID=UPI002629B5FB|nr:hemolysin family protein [uncultured Ruminococcus sp.]